MRTLTLHIGTEKTGTTTLQHWLSSNRAALRAQGILYPRAPGERNHVGLALYAGAYHRLGDLLAGERLQGRSQWRAYRTGLVERLRAEIEGTDSRHILLSNEHCSSRLLSDRSVERLSGLLHGLAHRVRIVLYLRRQDAFLLSRYSTLIRGGGRLSLPLIAFFARADYDYCRLVDRWARVFGADAISLRLFAPEHFVGGRLETDFQQAVGIPDISGFRMSTPANPSLDTQSLEFLRRFNAHVSALKGGQRNPLRGDVAGLLERRSGGSRLSLPRRLAQALIRRFAASNERLRQRYLPEHPAPLFDLEPQVDEALPKDLSADEAVAIAAYLWQAKQAEVLRLRAELEALKAAGRGGGSGQAPC